jgi:hypothetical protein
MAGAWLAIVDTFRKGVEYPLALSACVVYGMYVGLKYFELRERSKLAQTVLTSVQKLEQRNPALSAEQLHEFREAYTIPNGLMNFSTVHLWDRSRT